MKENKLPYQLGGSENEGLKSPSLEHSRPGQTCPCCPAQESEWAKPAQRGHLHAALRPRRKQGRPRKVETGGEKGMHEESSRSAHAYSQTGHLQGTPGVSELGICHMKGWGWRPAWNMCSSSPVQMADGARTPPCRWLWGLLYFLLPFSCYCWDSWREWQCAIVGKSVDLTKG